MINDLYDRFRHHLLVFLFISTCIGCTSHMVAKKGQEKAPPENEKKILAITTEEDAEAVYVKVKGNQDLTYTSVKQPSPLGVILYFPKTAIGFTETEFGTDSDLIGDIRTTTLQGDVKTTRVEISLKQDVLYAVAREGSDLNISFQKASITKASPTQTTDETIPQKSLTDESAPAATIFQSISTDLKENGIDISVKSNGAIRNYNAFTIETPARIVIDIFNIKSPQKTEKQIEVDSKWVKRIRCYSYEDRLRIVLDSELEYLSSFTAKPVLGGLMIEVGKSVSTSMENTQSIDNAAGENSSTSEAVTKTEQEPVSSDKEMPEAEPEPTSPSWVNRIDFLSKPEGKSSIVIGTTHPIKYDIQKIDEMRIQLKLYHTKFPDYRQRPLITTRFPSAVDRVTPFHTAALKDTALVTIELREAVPYHVEQEGTFLTVNFEASSVPPRSLEQANLPEWKQALAQAPGKPPEEKTDTKPVVLADEEIPDAAEPSGTDAGALDNTISETEVAAEMVRLGSKKKFTGEKIALDFYETDIKNVFRILRDVSGKNFAIDKDVAGKVTLSLDKPVPWDQVLDLVLRMNQLGTVMEGDIVRIATLTTLQNEQALQRAETAATLEQMREEKALEPLITEFIPVNYANATSDVMPHVVLTPERGSITVDERNNQIIITDTEEMVARAKETVRKIDQVTPQVLIEARVVEASTSFSRELGTQLSIQAGPIVTSEVGNGVIPEGTTSVDASATNPIAQPLGEVGVNFTKLTGSPLSISAVLSAAESEGEIKIISAPRVLTLDNKTARIRQGTQVPIPRLDDSGNTIIEYKDVDLELEVTPHVTPDKRITMTIKVTNNEIGTLINSIQSFTTKEANTELLIENGETIVIGGIRKARRDEGQTGVPGLKDIPVISWLFKKQTRSEDLEELLIFITPQIVQLEQRG